MSARRPIPTVLVAVLLMSLGLAACQDTIVKTLGPENDPTLYNQPDSLEFQASNLDNVYDRFLVTWVNTGSTAEILHRSFIHHGSGKITITDGAGKVVNTSPLEYNLDLETLPGTPGAWNVLIEFFGAKGRAEVILVGQP